ncbi:MAG: hypothetical protein M1823_003776 [Watsoniomyces obsoletus]|nr:MAG: hypothetical protein M1823_003776 [Watsoniomyces obsoletus]
MNPSPSLRRSTRNRPAKRYTDDAFEGYGNLPSDVASDDEQDADNRDNRSTNMGKQNHQKKRHYIRNVADEDEDEGSSSEGYRGEDQRSPEISSSDDEENEVGSDDDDSDYPITPAIRRALKESGVTFPRRFQKDRRRRPRRTIEEDFETTDEDDEEEDDEDEDDDQENRRMRAINETTFHSMSKLEKYFALFGDNHIDMLATLRGRDRWMKNQILPKRRQNDEDGGHGGFHRSYYENDEDGRRADGTSAAWDWMFADDDEARSGQDAFRQRQVLREISKDESRRYLLENDGDDDDEGMGVVMGPRNRPKLRILQNGECVTVEELWSEAERENPPKVPPVTPRKPRQGWMLNAGSPIKDLNWVPTGEGDMQFIAVATSPSEQPDLDLDEVMDDRPAPAYAPSPPTPACIQFWGFASDTNPENEDMMDLASTPQLRLVLCTDWGDLLQSKWCTIPADPRGEKQPDGQFALLAGIWGDGRIKVLQIPLNLLEGPTTRYTHVEQVAFESCPPDTVCTSLDWISPSEILVGCANGFIAVWDISESLCELHPNPHSAPQPISNPRPYLYFPLHPTYILSVISCSPSRPQLISTSGMDGYVRLTDLRSPVVDNVVSGRTRLGTSSMAWSDHIQSVLCTEENNTVRSLSLRHFHTSTAIARLRGQVSCIAPGVTHSSVMVGGFDGAVELMNPMRRFFIHKEPTTQLKWFLHEWRPGSAAAAPAVADGGENNERRKDNGICRISEGFKIHTPPLPRDTQSAKERLLDGTLSATIYEEKSAVINVAWCPSVRFGGWAAAGMGSGLVRIEDLAM